MHNVRVDRVKKLVVVTVSGFFQPEDISIVARNVHDAIRSLGEHAGKHVTLYDVSEAKISPGETIEAMRGVFNDPATDNLRARRLAFVTPSALARMQTQRLREARPDIAIFEDRDTALAWLLAQ